MKLLKGLFFLMLLCTGIQIVLTLVFANGGNHP